MKVTHLITTFPLLPRSMRNTLIHISLLLILVLSSCGRQPRGVLSVNEMADLIVDLQIADAYIDSDMGRFDSDSSMMVIKQSVFKKHGISQADYDSSLVWYAHNMEDYNKAYDKAVTKLKERYDKLNKDGKGDNDQPGEFMAGHTGAPTHDATPRYSPHEKHLKHLSTDVKSDSADLWQGERRYMLTQGSRRGFITFDLLPDANKQPGDRYQLAYKLLRGGNEFKVSLNVDYSDGGTAQITRGTNSDGWVSIDIQSDSTRHVRRIYGYVSYDMRQGHTAFVDSLSLMRTRLNKGNYGLIHVQRTLERGRR